MPAPTDTLSRPLRSLRVSVTDRCNLRCSYCMPEEDYVWLPKSDVLTFEEIGLVVDAFLDLGVDKVRITGGEPLVRQDLPDLIRQLAAKDRITDLALTTNGVLLDRHAQALKDAGLDRLTVSLDTLDPMTFRMLTRRDDLTRVHRGIQAARDAGLTDGLKIDTVLIRGVNDDQVLPLLEFGKDVGAEVRFIEYMDVGGATQWAMERVVSKNDVLAAVAADQGPATPVEETDIAARWAPADRYRLADGSTFGIISSTTQPFCRTCDRSRLTADGRWFTCLYAGDGHDLRPLVRDGDRSTDARRQAIADHVAALWTGRTDRGAEVRAAMRDRTALATSATLRTNPHLEMHTRGG